MWWRSSSKSVRERDWEHFFFDTWENINILSSLVLFLFNFWCGVKGTNILPDCIILNFPGLFIYVYIIQEELILWCNYSSVSLLLLSWDLIDCVLDHCGVSRKYFICCMTSFLCITAMIWLFLKKIFQTR